jgi:hypothetical protein
MKVVIFWDIPPCGPYVNRRLGGTHQFNLRSPYLPNNLLKVGFFARLIFDPEDGGNTFTYRLHGCISQKITGSLKFVVKNWKRSGVFLLDLGSPFKTSFHQYPTPHRIIIIIIRHKTGLFVVAALMGSLCLCSYSYVILL